MCQIAFDLPNEVLYDTHMTEQEASDFVRQTVAKELYKTMHVSVGYCAMIAGLSEEEFIKYLGRHKISIFHFDNDSEFQEELNVAQNHC